MTQSKFPPGWDEARVRRVLAHYEEQAEEEAVAEDEAASEDKSQTVMEIPSELAPPPERLLQKERKRCQEPISERRKMGPLLQSSNDRA